MYQYYLYLVDAATKRNDEKEAAKKKEPPKKKEEPEGTVTVKEGSKVIDPGSASVVIIGDATYYNLVGNKTASGEEFDPQSNNAAMFQPGVIKIGDVVNVQLKSNPNVYVTVTINDTGPFARGSDGKAIIPLQPDPNIIIDLTPAVFRDLAGSTAVGRVPVIVTRTGP
jgi:rare lipoprotein A (peptidoglycan hydrolase)